MADAWIYDLWRCCTAHAIMNGENLRMAGCVLGQRRAAITNRYAHFDHATPSEAAERVAMAIKGKLCQTQM